MRKFVIELMIRRCRLHSDQHFQRKKFQFQTSAEILNHKMTSTNFPEALKINKFSPCHISLKKARRFDGDLLPMRCYNFSYCLIARKYGARKG